MSALNCTQEHGRPRRRPRPRQASLRFSPVLADARLHLCVLAEPPQVRIAHIAALLAWTPRVQRFGNRMLIRFEHAPTAYWLAEALACRDAELLEVGADGGVVAVDNPQIVLGRYGYRGGRWMFGPGCNAALGIARGAVQAGGSFGRSGLRIQCPSAAAMLTLTAVLARLGIRAKPTEGEPRAVIGAGGVPGALVRLGIPDVAGQYRRLREADGNGKGTQS